MSAAYSAVVFGIALLAGSPSEAPADKNFEIDVSETTKAVKTGETGTIAVHIRPAEGYKVNEKGPLSLKLTAPETVALEKDRLGRTDAKGEITSPKFACGFDAKKKGTEPVTVDATFIICDTAGTMCEMKKERFEVGVVVD